MACEFHCPSLHLLIRREAYEILGRLSTRALESSWCAASALCISSKLRLVVSVQFLVVLGGAHRVTSFDREGIRVDCFDMDFLHGI
jgi:hypothetical protein